jgi:predicted DNA-binding protein
MSMAKRDVTAEASKLVEAIHGSVEDLDDLELAVNAGQQARDAGSHRLIAEVHDHGDRRQN